ncbi:aspartate/glutamate racemase family protein [Daeguia caeni]|uniref:Aspartate/glutamate racemase family protein n=1 Tax=Daeguia caeni TaxID=439612 RepID=A0ABV9H4K7_9HYPH
MSRRINFINPFGTTVYDSLIHETLSHYAMEGTTLDITHLEGCPSDMDYFYPKHFVENALYAAIQDAEAAGYDAVICGCCYDPGVRVGRELTNMPIIGPMEASLQLLAYHGRTAVIVADHVKACSLMKDNARLSGMEDLIVGYDVIDWYVRDMVNDTDAVAADVIEVSRRAVEKTGAEAVILNCTIISASYQKYLMKGGKPADVPVLNPNLMALMMAETTAHLRSKGALQLSRAAFYAQPHDDHFRKVSEITRKAWDATRPVRDQFF